MIDYKSISTVRVQLVRETHTDLKQIRVSKDVFELLDEIRHSDRESFYAIHLDAKSNAIAIDEVSRGTLNQSLVHPREVFKAAILSNACKLIIAHNHPSGNPSPSRDDHNVTKRLVEAGNIIGIEVVDHVIIGKDTWYSFVDEREMYVR